MKRPMKQKRPKIKSLIHKLKVHLRKKVMLKQKVKKEQRHQLRSQLKLNYLRTKNQMRIHAKILTTL